MKIKSASRKHVKSAAAYGILPRGRWKCPRAAY